jgi:glycosyltransferase involved in cell wall biosynthesis
MRVALLTNFVPPYRLPVFRELGRQAGELRVLISTAMERNRAWTPDWSDLDVVVQKTWTRERTWRHERFKERLEMHVPYDTIPQLRRWRPDAIVTAEFGLRSLQAIAYAKAARVPVVIWATLTEHLERDRGMLRNLLRRRLVRLADQIIVNGESGARYIRSIGGAAGKIVKVPQAVETAPLLAISLERDEAAAHRLLYCGAISQLKSAGMLVDAVDAWGQRNPTRNLHLTMVGDGPLRPALEQRALPRNVTIEWVGAVGYDQLPAHYARAGLLIFPTQGDEWGLVVNEALAAGVPVIGSIYSQAVDELIVDGQQGWRFAPDSVEAILAALTIALDTPAQTLATMRAQARSAVLQLTPARMAAQITAVLEQAAA